MKTRLFLIGLVGLFSFGPGFRSNVSTGRHPVQ